MKHLVRRIELMAVTVATTVATGSFPNLDGYMTKAIGLPVDRVGAIADIVAGTITLWHVRHERGRD